MAASFPTANNTYIPNLTVDPPRLTEHNRVWVQCNWAEGFIQLRVFNRMTGALMYHELFAPSSADTIRDFAPHAAGRLVEARIGLFAVVRSPHSYPINRYARVKPDDSVARLAFARKCKHPHEDICFRSKSPTTLGDGEDRNVSNERSAE